MRVLAKADSGFSDRLIKAHGWPASAVAPEYDLGNSRSKSRLVLPKKVHSCLHVERSLLEYDLRFVVVESGIHAKDHKTPVAHLTAGAKFRKLLVRCIMTMPMCGVPEVGRQSVALAGPSW